MRLDYSCKRSRLPLYISFFMRLWVDPEPVGRPAGSISRNWGTDLTHDAFLWAAPIGDGRTDCVEVAPSNTGPTFSCVVECKKASLDKLSPRCVVVGLSGRTLARSTAHCSAWVGAAPDLA